MESCIRGVTHRTRFLSDTFGGSRAREYQASVGVLWGAIARRTGKIEADLEDFRSRKEKDEKGDLEQGKREQSRSVWLGHPFFFKSCGCRGVVGERRHPRPINRHMAPKAAG